MSRKAIYALLLCALVWIVIIITCFHPIIGLLPESNFTLAPESRIPKWFSLPSELDRKDLKVEIFYYVPPPFIMANLKAVLIGPPPENKILEKKIGFVKDHPKFKDRFTKPSFNIGSIDGIEEIIEHRKRGPVFYISDDPKLKNR